MPAWLPRSSPVSSPWVDVGCALFTIDLTSCSELRTLVYWTDEDCASVVHTKNVIDPCPPVLEKTCTVKTAKKIYTSIAVAMGAF